MRKAEKERIAKRYNEIIAKIGAMYVAYAYNEFCEPDGLEDSDDDETIDNAVCGLEGDLEYLEADIEGLIDELNDHLTFLRETLKGEARRLQEIYDKYAA